MGFVVEVTVTQSHNYTVTIVVVIYTNLQLRDCLEAVKTSHKARDGQTLFQLLSNLEAQAQAQAETQAHI